ncbi:signal peptide peptidase SppA [Rhizobium sp. C4]|uniref:signal peptide peptidase SppA n=1 Tax=Rhizobium sp. C4 TaxID=1349800 RepID=UPI001E4D00C2|nr:signal peptide peptidase SppA [Rhizobium sp. C4]MCD2174546.1 signal peptide peptidase SppA [Rhizobium sp. C4]
MDNGIADRRALRRKVTFWRSLAIIVLVFVLATVWFRWPGTQGPGVNQIARVSISGLIQDDQDLTARLDRIAKADNVKALIVDISSPGGTTYGGETIYKALRRVAEKKPVVSDIRTLAASAGYMIALGGDRIIAGDMSITGSIGVLFQYPQAKELLDKIGVSLESIKSAPMKAEPSPFNPPSDQTKAMINAMVQDSFHWFVDLVAERRKMTPDQAMALSDGSIFTGRQALKNGLVDELGGLSEIKAYLKTRSVDPELPVIDWKPVPQGWAAMLPGALIHAAEWSGLDKDFSASALKMLGIQHLFLDGLVSVWQVDRG